jgi:hypothetical protein
MMTETAAPVEPNRLPVLAAEALEIITSRERVLALANELRLREIEKMRIGDKARPIYRLGGR